MEIIIFWGNCLGLFFHRICPLCLYTLDNISRLCVRVTMLNYGETIRDVIYTRNRTREWQ